MQTLKLVISYDGTNYHGWQEQPGLSTIEGLFKQRLKDVFKKEIAFTGASRTDAGVHARGQVARVHTDLPLTPHAFKKIMNDSLPCDIRVNEVVPVAQGFHPRVNVVQKTYLYTFFTDEPSPFMSRFGTVMKDLDLTLFKQALDIFRGTHDFRSFCTGDQGRSTVRTINSLDLVHHSTLGLYQVSITGPSFLRHMIRRIVGACYDVARNRATLCELEKALIDRDPNQHLFVAPPQGLMLHEICYKD